MCTDADLSHPHKGEREQAPAAHTHTHTHTHRRRQPQPQPQPQPATAPLFLSPSFCFEKADRQYPDSRFTYKEKKGRTLTLQLSSMKALPFNSFLFSMVESMSIKFQAVRFSASGRKCPSRQGMNPCHTAHASRCMSYRL